MYCYFDLIYQNFDSIYQDYNFIDENFDSIYQIYLKLNIAFSNIKFRFNFDWCDVIFNIH